jgi:hypothetical protein
MGVVDDYGVIRWMDVYTSRLVPNLISERLGIFDIE